MLAIYKSIYMFECVLCMYLITAKILFLQIKIEFYIICIKHFWNGVGEMHQKLLGVQYYIIYVGGIHHFNI